MICLWYPSLTKHVNSDTNFSLFCCRYRWNQRIQNISREITTCQNNCKNQLNELEIEPLSRKYFSETWLSNFLNFFQLLSIEGLAAGIQNTLHWYINVCIRKAKFSYIKQWYPTSVFLHCYEAKYSIVVLIFHFMYAHFMYFIYIIPLLKSYIPAVTLNFYTVECSMLWVEFVSSQKKKS